MKTTALWLQVCLWKVSQRYTLRKLEDHMPENYNDAKVYIFFEP
jgi:hypothetical protein